VEVLAMTARSSKEVQMNNDETLFRRIASISAIVSALLALLSTFFAITAVGFDIELLDQPVGLIKIGERGAELFGWSWILAAFGFYLLLIPAALCLNYWLKSQKPNLVSMYTVFGLGYCFIGAIELITMATVLAPMMQAYTEAIEPQRDLLTLNFQAIANLTSFSLSTLSYILGGVWWLGIGLELRARHRILGLVTVILGVATFGSGLGYLIHIEALARLEIINFFLGPLWALWIGIIIARGAQQPAQSVETATAT
jgi:hypothetical protein